MTALAKKIEKARLRMIELADKARAADLAWRRAMRKYNELRDEQEGRR